MKDNAEDKGNVIKKYLIKLKAFYNYCLCLPSFLIKSTLFMGMGKSR